jgi:hypothetical protein
MAALLLLVLALIGPAAAVLAIADSWHLAGDAWLVAEQTLRGGAPLLGLLGFGAALVACAVLALSAQRPREAAAAGLVGAGFLAWWLVALPVMEGVVPEASPSLWPAWRWQWAIGQAMAAALLLAALVLLLRAALAEAAEARRPGYAEAHEARAAAAKAMEARIEAAEIRDRQAEPPQPARPA